MSQNTFLRLRGQFLRSLLVIFCFAILALDLARPINLAAVDIGRHIKNGELLLQGERDVLYTNHYSFTCPNQPFINHHWLFGVMSFGVWKLGGFEGLSVLYIAVMLMALFFFLRAGFLRGNFALVMFFAFLALPVLADRREIRPEGVSMLFMGLYFYLLTKLSLGKIRRRWVFLILGVAQVIWVNTHIFFFMGPFLAALFLWEGQSRNCKVCVRSLVPLVFLLATVNLINPSGIAGALTPLNIFKEFGYNLAENQNIFFMMSRFPGEKAYAYYLGLVFIALAGIVWAVCARGLKAMAPFAFLAVFAACAGIKAVRLMTPFTFFFIPLAVFFYVQAMGQWPHYAHNKARAFLLTACVLLGVFYAWQIGSKPVGIGLAPGINVSANFFKGEGLKGPVFSNYDIGGYLIFHLAGTEKVFVDNRQEAFPPKFFKDVYVPMQEDNKVWMEVDAKYHFNSIFFYRHDLTPWGQHFLVERIQDPQWAPVFVDGYNIILLKRTPDNQSLIRRLELPKSMFAVTKGN